MGNIVLLDELTINKIAAGEVIERPASVVKEMVENSIDAGAKHITIEIKNGGISFIKITDDGKGIAKDDIELAFERHATSKIRTADDLESIKSMGFRGEALASIAAIANVELTSKTEQEEIGTKIKVEGGNVLELEETAAQKGTTIIVRNLFFNTPVRYKFLKKDFTESGYIEDVITRIAVANPDISIKLINTGKTIISTNGSSKIQDTIYSIFGKEVAENILEVNYEYEYIKIKGVIGKAEIARSNRSNQIFFVNNRYIKDKTLSSAVEQAYKGMLPIGKFAFLILNLEMPQTKVDVNVHPAKLEVRFSEEDVVFKSVYHAIKDTLLKQDLIPNEEKKLEIEENKKEAFKIKDFEQKSEELYKINTENKTNPILDNPIFASNKQAFEQLKKLQEDLKKEVSENPNLHITDKYKEMEEKYNSIINENYINKDQNEEQKTNENEDNKENLEVENPKGQNSQDVNNLSESETKKIEEESITDNIHEEKTQEKNVIDAKNEEETETNNLKIENEEEIEQSNIETENKEEETEQNNTEIENAEETAQNNTEIENIEENTESEKQENKEDIMEETPPNNKNILSFEQMYKELFGKEPYGGRKIEDENNTQKNYYTIDSNIEDSNVSMFEDSEGYKTFSYKFIGIAFNTYIILEIGNELYIMDQHASHERIMYEKVKKNFYKEEEKSTQLLILPDIVTLTHKEMEIAKENINLFKRAGFIIEEFGENTYKISGVPEMCIDLDTNELFKETLDEINQVARTAKQEKEEKFLATVACKAAVKANMKLTKEEVDSLMEDLLKLPNPFTCPHGRPTIIKMSKYEIERKFARK